MCIRDSREAFGEYTNGLFAMKLPTDAVRPSDITELMRRHMQYKNGTSYIQAVSYTHLAFLVVIVRFVMRDLPRDVKCSVYYTNNQRCHCR